MLIHRSILTVPLIDTRTRSIADLPLGHSIRPVVSSHSVLADKQHPSALSAVHHTPPPASQMVQTRSSSGRVPVSPSQPAGGGDVKPPARSTGGAGDRTTVPSKTRKRRANTPTAGSAKKRSTGGAGDRTTAASKTGKRRANTPTAGSAKKRSVAAADEPLAVNGTSPTHPRAAVPRAASVDPGLPPVKGVASVAGLCRTPFDPAGQMYLGAHVSGAGECRGGGGL